MNKGMLLVEVLVAGLVLGTILIATATALVVALDASVSSQMQNDATFLLQEELEPLLTIRDKGWVANMVNGTYYLAPSGSSWTLVATTSGETVGQFTRSVTISDIYRNSSGQIVTSGGIIDQSTKKAVATVSWQKVISHQIQATLYITRYKDNLQWIQTNKSEFDLGTKNGVATQLTGGSSTDGEVVLGAGGQGDWCKPQPIVGDVNLDKQGVANAITAIPFQVFAGTGENSSGPSFNNVTISEPADPKEPQGTVAGSMDGYKTNGIFGETNYAYLATDNNAKEVVIIDLTQKDSNNKYSEAGYFNAPGNGNGNSIYVYNNVGYMAAGSKLYNFSLSANRSGAQSIIDTDGVTLAGTGKKIFVSSSSGKTYAYVATSSTTSQFQIVDVSTSTDLKVVASLGLNDKEATDVFVNSSASRAYAVTANSSANPEFYIVDITNKSAPTKVSGGTYDTSTMSPKGVTVVTGGRALVVGTGGEEYQVVNISVEGSPSRCGGMDVDTGVNGAASVIEPDNDAYSYIITGDGNSELKMILGGPGGQFATSGTFESSTFDPGYQTAFNRFTVSYNKPIHTDIQFQVSGADPGADSTCNTATFTFVGPDGTTGTYFTTTTSPETFAIPLSPGPGYKSSARCFRYRATLTTSDAGQTPALYDFTVNYSP